jgi:tRNA threonylcarbamoyladenosine modification (KEOPS) complex  Pcc1 subunit
MSTNAKANICFKLKNKKQVETFLAALTPEANTPVARRATIELKQDSLFLVLKVETEDTVALRSTLNAYLRWISSIFNIIDLVERT